MTAYFGLIDVGNVKRATSSSSAAPPARPARRSGRSPRSRAPAKVIGIAGGPEKCAWIVDELGFDEAIDYKSDDVAARLREAAPDGIDLYFDNVGGEILDACLAQLAMRGRIVLCGAISSYNDRGAPTAPANYRQPDHQARAHGGLHHPRLLRPPRRGPAEMAGWLAEGKIKSSEHIVEGLEHAPEALNLLFTGGNTGKVIVQV